MTDGPSAQADQALRGPAGWAAALARGDGRMTGLCFALLTGFYLITAAGNVSETDDVYAFAYRAENFPVDHLSDPRLMLYHIAMRLLFLGASALGLDLSALTLMRCVSALCAAGSLMLMVRIVACDLKLSPAAAGLAAVILGVSYGFWRYAAEAEVYVPAIFCILLVFHGLMAHRQEAGWSHGVLAVAGWGGLAGLTVLLYQPSVIPLFFAFPLLLLYRRRIPQLAGYLVVGGAVVAGGYLIGFLAYWPDPLSASAFKAFLAQRAGEFMVPSLSLRTVVVSMIRSAFALAHDLASANWIFAFDPVVALIQRAFSNNIVTEEVFLAKRAGALVYFPFVTLTALGVLALWILRALWRPSFAFFRQRPFLVLLVWLLVNGAVIGRLNPAGLEAWIMVFPPMILIFAALMIEPCLRIGRGRLIAAFAGALFLHNAVGGMAMVFDPANEYDRQRGAWVIAEAGPEDLVIVVGNAGLGETLRYLSPARVAMIAVFQPPDVSISLLENDLNGLFTKTRGRDFDGDFLRDLIRETWASSGRLILFDHFFELPEPLRRIHRPEHDALDALKERLVRVYAAPDVGATYVLAAPIR